MIALHQLLGLVFARVAAEELRADGGALALPRGGMFAFSMSRVDDGDPKTLYHEEQALVSRAVPGRRRGFAAGRWCARDAMKRLQIPPAALLRGDAGEPLWPDAVYGSISHRRDLACAAVTARTRRRVGIDLERLDGASEPMDWSSILSDEELRRHCDLAHGRILAFSAKECFYKFGFPLLRRYVDFKEVEVRIEACGERFTIEAGALVPEGYDFQMDGVFEIEAAVATEESNWDAVKSLYR